MRLGGHHFYVSGKGKGRPEQEAIAGHDGTATSGPKAVVHLDVAEKNSFYFSVSRFVIV